jgi:LysM repeat protein
MTIRRVGVLGGGSGSPGLLAAILVGASCARPAPPPALPPTGPHPSEVVRSGETACAVAGRLGVSVPALLRANGLEAGSELTPGASLRIPKEELRHRVAPGETLGELASWYGISVERLAAENEIADPDRVPAGRRLHIPPGARTGCPPPAPRSSAIVRPQTAPSEPTRGSEVAAGPKAPGAQPDRDEARRLLFEARARYESAEFAGALDRTASAEPLLQRAGADPESDRLRSRAAWIAGLSYTGLGRREEAVAAFRRALALDPSLADDESLSPKVRRLLEAAREPATTPP